MAAHGHWIFLGPVDNLRRIISPGDNLADYYLIDRQSRVFSEYTGLELAQVITENGYKAVSLNTNNKQRIQRRVHRLAMFTFCYFPGCENLEVDHKDGNKFNNDISNLEWVTGKENVNRAIRNNLRSSWKGDRNPKSIVDVHTVHKIVDLALSGLLDDEISKITGISLWIIQDIVRGITWKTEVPQDIIVQIKQMRHPDILSLQQKHDLCKTFQDNILNKKDGFGMTKSFILNAMNIANIKIDDQTYRVAKRLFYRYQDPDITNLYNY